MKLSVIIASSYFGVNGWVMPPNQRIKIIPTIPTTELSMATGRAKNRQDDFLPEMSDMDESLVDVSLLDDGPPELDELAPLVRTMAKAADLRKAEQITALRVARVTTMTYFILVCTGNSRPQNQAIAASIQEDVEEKYGKEFVMRGNGVPEGNADSGWIVLDYGDVMVHIMTPKSRLFYDIEGQWRDKGGEYMDLEDVLLKEPIAPVKTDDAGSTMLGIAEEDDPFWS